VTLLLGIACGVLASLPFVGLARREVVTARVRVLSVAVHTERPRVATRMLRGLTRPPVIQSVSRVMGAPRARRRRRRRDALVERELPVVVDLIGVAVAAGCTPYIAIEHAVRFGPERTGAALHDVVRACALGQALDGALRDLGTSVPTLRPLAEALRTSTRLGSPAAPALARLAAEVRADVRRRAEARARTVPVRLCFPLVACILPAFALLTVAPAVFGGLHG
jgi:Flp pilus assembly protein TadB